MPFIRLEISSLFRIHSPVAHIISFRKKGNHCSQSGFSHGVSIATHGWPPQLQLHDWMRGLQSRKKRHHIYNLKLFYPARIGQVLEDRYQLATKWDPMEARSLSSPVDTLNNAAYNGVEHLTQIAGILGSPPATLLAAGKLKQLFYHYPRSLHALCGKEGKGELALTPARGPTGSRTAAARLWVRKQGNCCQGRGTEEISCFFFFFSNR